MRGSSESGWKGEGSESGPDSGPLRLWGVGGMTPVLLGLGVSGMAVLAREFR